MKNIRVKPELIVKYLYGLSELTEVSKQEYDRQNRFTDMRGDERRTCLGFKCNSSEVSIRVASSGQFNRSL